MLGTFMYSMASGSIFIEAMIGVVLATALFPTVQSQATVAANNATGTTALLWNLVPLLYVILAIVLIVGYIKVRS